MKDIEDNSQGQNQRESKTPFYFQRRNEHLDWRAIASLDLDRLIQSGDTETLLELSRPILFCRGESEFDGGKVDAGFLKVFKLCQLVGEVLRVAVQKDKALLKSWNERCCGLETAKKKLEEELKELKAELDKNIRELRETHVQILGTNDIEGEVDVCPYCQKKFFAPGSLHGHCQRRHQGMPIPQGASTVQPEMNPPLRGGVTLPTSTIQIQLPNVNPRKDSVTQTDCPKEEPPKEIRFEDDVVTICELLQKYAGGRHKAMAEKLAAQPQQQPVSFSPLGEGEDVHAILDRNMAQFQKRWDPFVEKLEVVLVSELKKVHDAIVTTQQNNNNNNNNNAAPCTSASCPRGPSTSTTALQPSAVIVDRPKQQEPPPPPSKPKSVEVCVGTDDPPPKSTSSQATNTVELRDIGVGTEDTEPPPPPPPKFKDVGSTADFGNIGGLNNSSAPTFLASAPPSPSRGVGVLQKQVFPSAQSALPVFYPATSSSTTTNNAARGFDDEDDGIFEVLDEEVDNEEDYLTLFVEEEAHCVQHKARKKKKKNVITKRLASSTPISSPGRQRPQELLNVSDYTLSDEDDGCLESSTRQSNNTSRVSSSPLSSDEEAVLLDPSQARFIPAHQTRSQVDLVRDRILASEVDARLEAVGIPPAANALSMEEMSRALQLVKADRRSKKREDEDGIFVVEEEMANLKEDVKEKAVLELAKRTYEAEVHKVEKEKEEGGGRGTLVRKARSSLGSLVNMIGFGSKSKKKKPSLEKPKSKPIFSSSSKPSIFSLWRNQKKGSSPRGPLPAPRSSRSLTQLLETLRKKSKSKSKSKSSLNLSGGSISSGSGSGARSSKRVKKSTPPPEKPPRRLTTSASLTTTPSGRKSSASATVDFHPIPTPMPRRRKASRKEVLVEERSSFTRLDGSRKGFRSKKDKGTASSSSSFSRHNHSSSLTEEDEEEENGAGDYERRRMKPLPAQRKLGKPALGKSPKLPSIIGEDTSVWEQDDDDEEEEERGGGGGDAATLAKVQVNQKNKAKADDNEDVRPPLLLAKVTSSSSKTTTITTDTRMKGSEEEESIVHLQKEKDNFAIDSTSDSPASFFNKFLVRGGDQVIKSTTNRSEFAWEIPPSTQPRIMSASSISSRQFATSSGRNVTTTKNADTIVPRPRTTPFDLNNKAVEKQQQQQQREEKKNTFDDWDD